MTLNPFRRLREAGVLGMNERNADYVQAHNPRARFPLVDDKLRTKRLAEDAGIAVPRLLAVLRSGREAHRLERHFDTADGFVVKPAQGSGGNGILVLHGRLGPHFRDGAGAAVTREDLAHHVAGIGSGMYSLGARADVAVVEERIEFDPLFAPVSYGGVPDIRTVVYRGMPVLAMIRLPTRQSGGKANLHLGGVGVGVDLASGVTAHAVRGDRSVAHHPDTLGQLAGIAIPGWDRLLELAARCHDLCGLGYLGVDVALDRDRGPLVLELNARPGLSVQLANRTGLRDRLARIDALESIPHTAAERARLAAELFADGAEPAVRSVA